MAVLNPSATSAGLALIEGRRRLDMAESAWLTDLARFDTSGAWSADGALCCAAWLVHRCHMARSTAKERLRVAHALARRPQLQSAYANGRLSYSKVRAITRLTEASAEVDEALLAYAENGATAVELDRVVAYAHALADQHRPLRPDAAFERRGIRVIDTRDGLTTLALTLPTEDAERLLAVLDTYIRHLGRPDPVDRAPAGDGLAPETAADPVEEAPAGAPLDPPTWTQRRADALIDLLETAVGHVDAASTINVDRFNLNVTIDYATLIERAPGVATIGDHHMTGETARRLACDCGITRIITDGPSTILDLGRTTRAWTAAQRRASNHRYGGRCAIPGCNRRVTQLHHAKHWADGGASDLDNALPLCHGHHRLVHEGRWTVDTTPDQPGITATVTSPTGTRIDIPTPPAHIAA